MTDQGPGILDRIAKLIDCDGLSLETRTALSLLLLGGRDGHAFMSMSKLATRLGTTPRALRRVCQRIEDSRGIVVVKGSGRGRHTSFMVAPGAEHGQFVHAWRDEKGGPSGPDDGGKGDSSVLKGGPSGPPPAEKGGQLGPERGTVRSERGTEMVAKGDRPVPHNQLQPVLNNSKTEVRTPLVPSTSTTAAATQPTAKREASRTPKPTRAATAPSDVSFGRDSKSLFSSAARDKRAPVLEPTRRPAPRDLHDWMERAGVFAGRERQERALELSANSCTPADLDTLMRFAAASSSQSPRRAGNPAGLLATWLRASELWRDKLHEADKAGFGDDRHLRRRRQA